jgi:hypothetical protein
MFEVINAAVVGQEVLNKIENKSYQVSLANTCVSQHGA